MRFEIEPAEGLGPTGGLRVITEIPDFTLGRLEGQNGVGKTLAVRLLQLVTGEQPWAGLELAWRTLREHLGPTYVTIEGVRLAPGAPHTSVLRWSLVPTEWPENPQEEGPWNNAFLDGRSEPLSLERLR